MEQIIHGSCYCGKVKIEISGPIFGFKHCHCKTCQKLSGTAFASNAIVSAEHFRIVAGRDFVHDYATSARKVMHFCGNCCSPIYAHMPENSEEVYIRMGMLDEDPGLTPAYHWWVEQKAPWFDILDGRPQFDRVPPS